jgi:hypothetical protein
MKNLRFVCAQPAIPYYTWQVEVMIHNFIEMGVNPNNMDIVCCIEDSIIPEQWLKLATEYNYVRFFFYNDTRINKGYTSSIRPNILKQHWEARPEIHNDTIFYHDCDIVFTKPINEWLTDKMVNDDNWYGSDCRWYISHSYIKSKGDDILKAMCDIVQIDKKIIEDNELNSIGAQYIMKGIDSEFWNAVELDSESLFVNITELSNQKISEDRHTISPDMYRIPYHPIQIWCADMWAVLWNAWKMGYKTICHSNLEFSWATSPDNLWDTNNIFHNAGVTCSCNGLFYKAEYVNKLPYNENLNIKEGTTSYEYWKLIQKTAKKTVLI